MAKDTLCEVSIKSKEFGTYLSLNGNNTKTYNTSGSGVATCQTYVGTWERLQCENHADGTFSILSSEFPGVYLRLDGDTLAKNQKKAENGGGTANCQFWKDSAGQGQERFKFHPQSDGTKTIESAAFPGVYLRMDAKVLNNKIGGVNGQWGAYGWEKFIVTVL